MYFGDISVHSGFGWLFLINVDLAIFQPYLDLEAGDNQSLKIQVARRGIEPRSSCSASQELNHSATAAPLSTVGEIYVHKGYCMIEMAMFHDFMQPLISLKIFFSNLIIFRF